MRIFFVELVLHMEGQPVYHLLPHLGPVSCRAQPPAQERVTHPRSWEEVLLSPGYTTHVVLSLEGVVELDTELRSPLF